MNHLALLMSVIVLSVFAIAGCSDGESSSGEEGRSGTNEHSREAESGEEDGGGGEDGEESGTEFGLGDTFDEVRAGARLILSYDADANAFNGTVENTTRSNLSRVRVEVHLSNGIELGPTTPVDLASGESIDVTLRASTQPFTSWSAHPEVGGGDSAESGEGGGEHGGEGSEGGGEHGGSEGSESGSERGEHE